MPMKALMYSYYVGKSILNPFLYLLYIADLSADTNVSIITFADDTVVLAIYKNPKHI